MIFRAIVFAVRSAPVPIVLCCLCLLLGVFARPAEASPIAVQDASFDSRSLSVGNWSNTITPWQESGGTGNGNGFVERLSGFAADGLNHLGMNLGHNVWQDLGVTYQPNTRYTLTVAVGNRNTTHTHAANQSRYILAASDGTVFATGSFNTSTIPSGTFADAPPLTFETTSPAANGKTIRILLEARGSGRSHFDRVRLTAVSTDLPPVNTDLEVPALVERQMFPAQIAQTVEIPLTSNLPDEQSWTAEIESPVSWLSYETLSGTTPAPLRVRFDPASLGSGVHTTWVIVRAGAATYRMAVTLRLSELAISKFVPDPGRPLVYAIHKNGLNEGALVVLDSITRRILHATPIGKEPTDCDVSEDGSKVWVINSKGPSLTAVSTDTWQVVETIPLTEFSSRSRVNTEPGAHVKCGKGSIIYYVDEQWGPRLRVFDTATRSVLQTFSAESGATPDTTNNFGYGDIGLNPQRTMLFGWRQYGDSAGVGGSHIVRFDIRPDGTLANFARSANHSSGNFDRAPYDTPVLISGDGPRVLIKDREVDPVDLDAFPLVYPAPLYSISSNGRIAASASKIFSTSDAREIGSLPVTTPVQAILPDLSALVVFNTATKTVGWVDLVASLGGEALGLAVFPADRAVVTSPSRLEWPALTGITRYRVYLGTDEAVVNAATPGSASELGETTDTWMDLATAPGTGRHFWRVVPLDGNAQPIGNGMTLSFNVANMAFSRTSIRAATIAGNPNLPETIRFSAPATRNWSASANVPWIGFASATGSTPGELNIVINASSLTAGTHNGEVMVTCD